MFIVYAFMKKSMLIKKGQVEVLKKYLYNGIINAR